MSQVETFATLPMWVGFVGLVLVVLALDLYVLGGRHAHRVSSREALCWVLAWTALALLFGVLLWWFLDGTLGRAVAHRKVLEFFTGYLIELSLSVDNMFVFSLIFGYFAVPLELQRRVLLYGVLGAIVMRVSMILAGVWLLSQFSWLFYALGGLLVVTGGRMLAKADYEPDIARNPLVRFLRSSMRITKEYHGESFFVRIGGLPYATPMFVVLLMIEASDAVFAVDSIPAIFAVTTDPFLVFTSNIFAIMGLRAMYFLLADMRERFRYLKHGLAAVLIIIGGKMLAAPWFHVPVQWSLGAVGLILLASVVASRILPGRTAASAARPKAKASKNRRFAMNTIIFATDGSSYSDAAARYLVGSPLLNRDFVVHVVHCEPDVTGEVQAFIGKAGIDAWHHEESGKAMKSAVDILTDGGVSFECHELTGHAAEKIIEYAAKVDAAAIVMGSHHRGQFVDAVLRSVCGRIVANAPCPVLLV